MYKLEFFKDKRKEYRWRLISSNGKIVASSAGDGYKREFYCRKIALKLFSCNPKVRIEE